MGCTLSETVLPTLFNMSFLISVLLLDAVISHLDSNILMKVYSSMDDDQIGVSVG